MQKTTKIGIMSILVAIGAIAGISLQSQPIGCSMDDEIIYVNTGTNQKLSIVLPNGDSKCGIVLSKDNYTKLQNNVGIMTVGDRIRNTNEPINTNYCGLAKWIFIGHLNYYDDITKKFENYMFPRECANEILPSVGLPIWYGKVWLWYESDQITQDDILNGMRFLLK